MHAITDFGAFVGAVFIFLALPGPGTFCVLNSAARHGKKGGYAAVAGLIVADQILLWLALAGLAAVLLAHPSIFRAMQYLGALYLIYLGVRLVLTRARGSKSVIPFSQMADFRRGFFITLINPKALIFYLAFLPLFINQNDDPGMATWSLMAVTIAACTLVYGSFLIVVGQTLAQTLARRPKIGQWGNRLAGAFLIAFGVKLTFS